MKKGKKILAIALVCILILVAIGFTLFRSGALVKPTDQSLARLKEVPQYDVIQWQAEREGQLIEDYQGSIYTPESPYIIIDPYEMNPLSALVMFETEKPCDVQVTIAGDDAYATYTYVKEAGSTHLEVPVIGLYAGRDNKVTLTMLYQDGMSQTTQHIIATEPLPFDMQEYELEVSKPEKMEPGISLFIACFNHSYNVLLDHNAQIRGYLSNPDMAHGTSMILLKNGNMMATGDEYKQVPYNMTSLFEFNWLGKIFTEYEIPNAVHHDISELPNGDILAVSNNANMFQTGTREDVVIIIDRETANVIKEYDFRNIIDETRNPYHHFHPDIKNILNIDWMHTNAAVYRQDNNSIIVSSPTQSMLININADTSEINWILGPHEGYEGSSEFLKQYLLTPVGEDFEWQWTQHHPMVLPDMDENPDTIDILLFDNGQSKSFTKENSVAPENNYSRGVQFRIDEKAKTVEQIWQYGKERGSDCYATFLGDADYLYETGNRIMAFGGQLRNNGVPVDDIVSGVTGDTITNSRVIEVTQEKEVVFEVSVHDTPSSPSAETYQIKRLPLYSANSFDYSLGEVQGKRLGTSYYCPQDTQTSAPNLYIGKLGESFNQLYRQGNRLIVNGQQTNDGKPYILSQSVLVFRSKDNVYLYPANSGLNGQYFASIDLSDFAPGEYQISVAGGVKEGNDTSVEKITKGHVLTDYKITIEDMSL